MSSCSVLVDLSQWKSSNSSTLEACKQRNSYGFSLFILPSLLNFVLMPCSSGGWIWEPLRSLWMLMYWRLTSLFQRYNVPYNLLDITLISEKLIAYCWLQGRDGDDTYAKTAAGSAVKVFLFIESFCLNN